VGRLLSSSEAAAVQRAPAPVLSGSGAPVIQRKVDCSLTHLDNECAGAAGSCATAKNYCSTKYPNQPDMATLHANAVKGATDYKSKYPNAAANLLHFLGASGSEKVMPVDLFRNHSETKNKYSVHMAKFLEGARKRWKSGELKVGGPPVEMVWTDTANAFDSGGYSDLGLAVGGYTVCSKVMATAKSGKDFGDPDYVYVRFDPWTMQAFDCYNWDPGKGIGLGFATDSDLCCLENAGLAKHFRVRTEVWKEAFPPERLLKINADKEPEKPSQPPPPPKKEKKDDDR
jgi:hypothetical protein